MKNCAVAALVLLLVGCSTTPGDAASRAGHPQQAAELYQRGAEQGDAAAALKLGLLIEEGSVSSDQFGSPGRWYLKACDLGNYIACHNVGVGYEYGQGGFEKNYESARAYYHRAATQGYMQSQYNLGTLYSNKYFADDIEGLKWLLASQARARSCSKNELCQWILRDPPGHIAKLKARMSAEQIGQAEAQAVEVGANEQSGT